MRFRNLTRCVALAMVAVAALIAEEYQGQVKFAGLLLPGVTMIATLGEKTQAAVSDQQGVFSFSDLPDGTWPFQVEKPGFSPIKQEVTSGSGLPGPSLPLDQMRTVSPSAIPGQTMVTDRVERQSENHHDPVTDDPPRVPDVLRTRCGQLNFKMGIDIFCGHVTIGNVTNGHGEAIWRNEKAWAIWSSR